MEKRGEQYKLRGREKERDNGIKGEMEKVKIGESEILRKGE